METLKFGNIYSFKPYFELKKKIILKNPIKNYKIKKINMVINLLMKKILCLIIVLKKMYLKIFYYYSYKKF